MQALKNGFKRLQRPATLRFRGEAAFLPKACRFFFFLYIFRQFSPYVYYLVSVSILRSYSKPTHSSPSQVSLPLSTPLFLKYFVLSVEKLDRQCFYSTLKSYSIGPLTHNISLCLSKNKPRQIYSKL